MREKPRSVGRGLLLSFIAAASFAAAVISADIFAWGVMPPAPTHQHILKEAYKLLKADPAYDQKKFPTLEAILSQEGVNWANVEFTGKGTTGFDVSKLEGPGPDSKGNSPFSWHYYNPKTGEGEGPSAVKRFFRYLAGGMLKGGEDALPKAAAWSAHFMADMHCPYHINGAVRSTAETILKEQAAKHKNTKFTGSVFLTSDVAGSDKLSYLSPIKSLSHNFKTEMTRFLGTAEDWFDPWYYNGNTETMMSNMSSHIAWESTVKTSQYNLAGYAPGWSNGRPAFDKRVDVVSAQAAALAARSAKQVRSRLDYYFDNPDMAVNMAVRNVYTMWRASLSAIAPKIETKLKDGLLSVTGIVANEGSAALTGAKARLTAEGCAVVQGDAVQKLDVIKPGDKSAKPSWSVKLSTDTCKLKLEAAGSYGAPDLQYASASAEVKPEKTEEVKPTAEASGAQDFSAVFFVDKMKLKYAKPLEIGGKTETHVTEYKRLETSVKDLTGTAISWSGNSFSRKASSSNYKDWNRPRGDYEQSIKGTLDATGNTLQKVEITLVYTWTDETCPWGGQYLMQKTKYVFTDIPFSSQGYDGNYGATTYRYVLGGPELKGHLASIEYQSVDCYHPQNSYEYANIDWDTTAASTSFVFELRKK